MARLQRFAWQIPIPETPGNASCADRQKTLTSRRVLYLIRHGETAWSLSGQHTGRTDIHLTKKGAQDARNLGASLLPANPSHVFTSPRQRAQQTCALAGFGSIAQIESDLAEWDYGDYEGLRSAEILQKRPGWNIFLDGCPSGESPAQVSDRADRFIAKCRELEGNIAAFTHGHFGRVLAARWIGLSVCEGQRFFLSTASVSALGYEHNSPVINLWNATQP